MKQFRVQSTEYRVQSNVNNWERIDFFETIMVYRL
jgi:hypothetical protein